MNPRFRGADELDLHGAWLQVDELNSQGQHLSLPTKLLNTDFHMSLSPREQRSKFNFGVSLVLGSVFQDPKARLPVRAIASTCLNRAGRDDALPVVD